MGQGAYAIMTILSFIIVLGFLVLVHEWGHFIVARRAGIRVEKFSIGFGPKIASFKKGETEYRISILPLGGYVKLYGEDPAGEAEGDEKKATLIASSPDAFAAKPVRLRLATVLAGPSMNLVVCLLLMPLVFMVGRMMPEIFEKPPQIIGVKPDSPALKAGLKKGDLIQSIDGKAMKSWSDVMNWIILYPDHETKMVVERDRQSQEIFLVTSSPPHTKQKVGYTGFEPLYFWGNDPVVGDIAPGSPAERGGLAPQDRILSINGNEVSLWDEMTDLIRGSDGKPLTVTYKRKEAVRTAVVSPQFQEEAAIWIIGITKYIDPGLYVKKRYSFFEAVREGTRENVKLLFLTGDVLKRLFTFKLSYKALGGPIQIAQATGMAARAGFGEFLYFMAFLSLQLGILNLLPIPVLDGGHVLFMTIEGIRRKPLSLKVKSAFVHAGLFFLLGLMLLITVNDIDRLWGFANIWEKIRGIF